MKLCWGNVVLVVVVRLLKTHVSCVHRASPRYKSVMSTSYRMACMVQASHSANSECDARTRLYTYEYYLRLVGSDSDWEYQNGLYKRRINLNT